MVHFAWNWAAFDWASFWLGFTAFPVMLLSIAGIVKLIAGRQQKIGA
jgi:hypothetical protein